MSITLKRVDVPMASAIPVSKEGPSNRPAAAGAMPDRIEAWPLQWTRLALPSPMARKPEKTDTFSLTGFSDSSSGVNFQATQITAAAFNQVAHTVTLTGTGTDNGRAVTFTIVAADSSLAPPGLFGITLTDGYNNSGNLLDGSVTVY